MPPRSLGTTSVPLAWAMVESTLESSAPSLEGGVGIEELLKLVLPSPVKNLSAGPPPQTILGLSNVLEVLLTS